MAYTICGHSCLVLEARRKWCHCHAISHAYGLITLVIYSCSPCSFLFYSICFSYQVMKKYKSTSPSANQVKHLWKTNRTEEKLDLISQHENGEWIVDTWHHVRFAHSSVYIQYMIMVIELQKVLSQDVKCLCSKSTTVLSERTVPKTMRVSL